MELACSTRKPRLPVETCEHIIDWCATGFWPQRTLINCLLTCRSWAPRSRLRLYTDVHIRTEEQLMRFVSILRTNPRLGSVVCHLRLGELDPLGNLHDQSQPQHWIHLAASRLPVLSSLRRITFVQLPTESPWYAMLMRQYRKFTNVRELCLAYPPSMVPQDLERIVSFLPDLTSLGLRDHLYSFSSSSSNFPPIRQDSFSHITLYHPTSSQSSVADIHMRNVILRRTSPRYILLSSLPSHVPPNANFDSLSTNLLPLSTSLSTFSREEHIREGLMKALVMEWEVAVMDLTDNVKVCGDYPESTGSFADIWKGEWNEKGLMGIEEQFVALKVLRRFRIEGGVNEKNLKRFKHEVLTWYRLRHPHIIQFYGIVRWRRMLAIVSPWCKNGTVVQYLKEINPDADRLALMAQIASGVAYLHNLEPVVIHGNLRGDNVLVDGAGRALIADFGVSNVIDVDSFEEPLLDYQWTAPEIIYSLVDSLVENGGRVPELTKANDVYAFAAVCLEILTGKLPYSRDKTADRIIERKMAGEKPYDSRYEALQSYPRMSYHTQEELWAILDRCWEDCDLRPSMSEVEASFVSLANAEHLT
ncbi:unnamed protein product [Somion occarium]|uniref:Protein kinase domain-containing protein n=1 Tax=Somion occarium TaxID=3059160 RepID=A0ABP1E920_9APHY